MFLWIQGWIAFDVNGRRFYRFDRAQKEAGELSATRLDVHLHGFRIGVGWRPIASSFAAGRLPRHGTPDTHPKLQT